MIQTVVLLCSDIFERLYTWVIVQCYGLCSFKTIKRKLNKIYKRARKLKEDEIGKTTKHLAK